MKKAVEMLEYESEYVRQGYCAICGADEVGRGPLAGPVVVAAVCMPLETDKLIDGVNDSKKLSPKRREQLYDVILRTADAYRIAEIAPEEIDSINILNATKKAMREAINALKDRCDLALTDALDPGAELRCVPIVKGDAKSYNIAAASIVAKVYRDRLMDEYAKLYPQYGFERNKGYGTREHIDAIGAYGLCPIHRRSFVTHFAIGGGNGT